MPSSGTAKPSSFGALAADPEAAGDEDDADITAPIDVERQSTTLRPAVPRKGPSYQNIGRGLRSSSAVGRAIHPRSTGTS